MTKLRNLILSMAPFLCVRHEWQSATHPCPWCAMEQR